MDESIAWLLQARADRQAAEQMLTSDESPCHGIAKCQQTVERGVKSLVAALREARILDMQVGYRHEVVRFVEALIRLPRANDRRNLQNHLCGLFDQETRRGIRELDALAPRRPEPRALHARNTEYPFQLTELEWTYPAADSHFDEDEFQRFRALAHRVVHNAARIVSAIRRMPG